MFGAALGVREAYPFFNGAIGTSTARLRTVLLGGQEYTIDTTKYMRQSVDTLRDGVVTNSQVDDRLFDVQGAWARYRYSWHRGAGQMLADLREDADGFRFDTSAGVDPWTENELTLLRDVDTKIDLSSVASDEMAFARANGRLFFSNGAAVYRSTDDGETWAAVNHPGFTTITSMTSDGYNLYVGGVEGVVIYAAGGTGPTGFPTPVTRNVTKLAYVAGHLLASEAGTGALIEFAAAGTVSTISTPATPTWRWTLMEAVGSRIYIGGYAGDRSELRTMDVTNTGALAVAGEVAPLLPGEKLYAGLAYAGIIVLATSAGVRVANVGPAGTLTYGPVIDDFGAVYALGAQGRFVYCGLANGGLARLALDVFTDTLRPAYARDLVRPNTIREASAIAVAADGRPLFATAQHAMVKAAATRRVAVGNVDAGRLYFGTVEKKGMSSLIATFAPLVAGQSITCRVYDDRDQLILSRTSANPGATELSIDAGAPVLGWVRVVFELATSSGISPTLLRWRMRAYPITPLVQQWIVPLLLGTRVTMGMGSGVDVAMVVLMEVERIAGWCASKEPIVYREGDRGYRVRVDAFQLAEVAWNDEGKFFDGTCTVRLVEV